MSTKKRIIQASIDLFNEHGEQNISTNHIAAHLEISPGNLYYHFKNKTDILRHIFDLYREHLQTRFIPLDRNKDILEQLVAYVDSLFDLMWQFHFFYDNLDDILARDPELKKEYIALQDNLSEQVKAVLVGLKHSQIIDIDDEDIPDLAHSIKLMSSFWTPYVKTHNLSGKILQSDIYQGVVKVLLLFKPYSYGDGLTQITQLQNKYKALAEA